jgi:hypothetical protein
MRRHNGVIRGAAASGNLAESEECRNASWYRHVLQKLFHAIFVVIKERIERCHILLFPAKFSTIGRVLKSVSW